MPTTTYVALATETLSATDTSITFSSIPSSTYKDYIMVMEGEAVSPYAVLYFRINGDTGTNYESVYMRQGGAGAQSSSTSGDKMGLSASGIEGANRGTFRAHFIDASATNKHKTVLTRMDGYQDGSTTYSTEAWAGRWANNNAITSIELLIVGGGMATGTVISLYGIEA